MTPIARFAALVAWLLLSTFGADARPRSDFRHAKNQLAKEGVFTGRCGSSAPGRAFCRWFRIDSRRVVGRSAEGVLIATRMTHWMSENPLDDFPPHPTHRRIDLRTVFLLLKAALGRHLPECTWEVESHSDLAR